MNKLDSLKNITNVMADTSDIEDIRRYQPHDVTTNPSSILRFVEDRKNSYFIKDIFSSFDFRNLPEKEIISDLYNIILVKLTLEILKIVPGRISIEIDSRFSYDEDYCFTKSKDVIHKLEKEGIQRDRVLIKIAATWQGIQAAKRLEDIGINCNLTLLFSLAQAKACAISKVHSISPFVGRITDWYQKNKDEESFDLPLKDPGVSFVKEVYEYYKINKYRTNIIGASIRNINHIFDLSWCDYLTIPSYLLQELKNSPGTIDNNMSPISYSMGYCETSSKMTESDFYWEHCSNNMANFNLSNGIYKFFLDQNRIKKIIFDRFL